MNDIKSYWQPIAGILGFTFFLGGFVQRASTQAELAVQKTENAALHADVMTLVSNEKDHDRNITMLTDKLGALTDALKAQQDQINSLKKGK